MKNLIAFAISICFLLVFVGCESAINIEAEQEADLLVVIEVFDTHIICGTDTARYSVPNWFKDKNVQPNEFIKIYHNGIVLELWPMQFAKIDKMEYIAPTGEICIATKDTVVVNKVFVEQSNATIPLKKKLSNADTALFISYMSNLSDSSEHVCNCIPDCEHPMTKVTGFPFFRNRTDFLTIRVLSQLEGITPLSHRKIPKIRKVLNTLT